jgi:hypothetical protein
VLLHLFQISTKAVTKRKIAQPQPIEIEQTNDMSTEVTFCTIVLNGINTTTCHCNYL